MSVPGKLQPVLDPRGICRRTFLRGAGVAMALPWLEAVPFWTGSAGAGGVTTAFPKRFATLFMACGINPNHWWARGNGADMELSRTLEPMAPFKAKLNVIDGLFNRNATGVGIHPGQTGNILSGASLQRGAELRGGVSMDQVLATMQRPANGLPEDIREHMRLMCDIVALGFQTDKTRVATLLLCRDISGLFYPFLNVPASHHPASHNDTSDAYERVARYYVSQLAYLATRLESMREGDGTVLDNSCLLFLSNMFSGSRHDNSKLPVVLVGGLGGTLQTGRVLDYKARGDAGRN